MLFRHGLPASLSLLLLAALPARVLAGDVLSTDGYTICLQNSSIKATDFNVQFNRLTNVVKFSVSGESDREQKVMAELTVSAYGNQVYSKKFNPCDPQTKVKQLCPVPAGTFTAVGTRTVPAQYASMIPSIAYSIPDLDGEGKLILTSLDGGKPVACIDSIIGNGKTAKVAAVTYAAAGMAGAALVMSGIGSIASFNNGGGGTPSPSFIETLGWFQSMAMNGMLSVSYPGVYRSFTQNFGFSTGLVPWDSLQRSIDNFRASTGGNLTDDNIGYLRRTTLVSTANSNSGPSKRSLASDVLSRSWLFARDIHTSINGSSQAQPANSTSGSHQQVATVSGIQGYAEELLVPKSNVFMNVLLVFAIAIAAVTAGILLFKVILEAWALFGSFPKSLVSFRKRYWWLLAKTITNMILALYSVWTLYCIYQFTIGDSWAAKVLAGVTLGIFTAILIAFTVVIYMKARKSQKMEGDSSVLYDDKETWRKYSLFYDAYKRSYWWLFVPVIIYMFAKGCVIAAADGHGIIQCGGQLIVDAILLILLLWYRPYTFKSGNWINIVIQVVRVLSVVCILVFVEELGVSQTTKTITGLVLIVMQAVLTGLLAILIAVNALIQCCKKNPHRLARKEAEKNQRDHDELTPLDAHNSMLMYDMDKKDPEFDITSMHTRGRSQNGYDMVSNRDATPIGYRDDSRDPLSKTGQRMGSRDDTLRSASPDRYSWHREPQLPDLSHTGRGVAI